MQRRHFLSQTASTLAALSSPTLAAGAAEPTPQELAAGSRPEAPPPTATTFARPVPLVPIQARPDRIIAVNVCTRPFRAQGPRIEAEALGRQTVIHNYGHGGSGWSLSWGAATWALRLALATRERRIAVIGCGAIGLTSALVAQRAGLRVRIYARERPPEVRSSLATGVWSPDSRICAEAHATPAFERAWEAMARTSFRTYQNLLGLAGDPVEWRDGYALSDQPFGQPAAGGHDDDDGGEPPYPDLEARLLGDLRTRSLPLAPHEHPFPVAHVRRYTQLTFNLSAYSRLLLEEFQRNGGEIETREFASPRQFAGLPEKTLIHATGYGARALLGDESITPVRGQTVKLIPQPGVNYGLAYNGHNLFMVPRRDGILVQAQGEHDFGNADATPDRAEAEAVVARLATLFVPPENARRYFRAVVRDRSSGR